MAETRRERKGFFPRPTQEKHRAGSQRGQAPGSPSPSPGTAARTAPRTSSQPREEPHMAPELFFFFGAMRGYGSASRAKGKAKGSAGSGRALCGPTRPGTAARATRGRAVPRPPRKRGKGRRLRRHDSVCGSPIPSRAPRPQSLPVGEEGAQQTP